MGVALGLRVLAFGGALVVVCGCGASQPRVAAAPTQAPLSALPPARPSHTGEGPATPDCPPATWWDGVLCAHAPATCGAWDGESCERAPSLPQADRAAEQLAAIDTDARAICPLHDDASQVDLGSNALEVKDAVDKALGQASEVEKRLEHFETVHRTAIWWVRAEVRAGALYDCLWTSLERAHPAFFTPAQQAALAKLQGLQQRLSLVNPTSASTVAQTIAQTQGMVIATWTSTRDQYLEVLATRMVRHYATADVLSRRYAFDGVEIARARRRLPAIASELGDDKMSSLLAELPDPTDPAPDPKDRRRLRYKGEVWRAFPAP